MVIEDQCAHDFDCRQRCGKLSWDESSYRSISGARAVIITPVKSKNKTPRLKYCPASESTLVAGHLPCMVAWTREQTACGIESLLASPIRKDR